MKVKDIVFFVLLGIFAGVAIAIGGTASLYANNLLAGLWGKLAGAVLFSLGMYTVIAFGLKLFTGMVSLIPTMGAKNWWQLPLCFIANAVGVSLIALIVRYSFIGDTLAAQAQALINGKFADELWAVKTLLSAIMCGLLITFSVWAPRYAKEKGLSATVGVMLPIIVFVFCSFDHSVADVYYLALGGIWSWQAVAYVLLAILGNVIGGVLFPLVTLFLKKNNG